MRKLAFSLLLAAFATPAMAEADFHDFEVNGFKLGMQEQELTPLLKKVCVYGKKPLRSQKSDSSSDYIVGATHVECDVSKNEKLDLYTDKAYGIIQIEKKQVIDMPKGLSGDAYDKYILEIKDKFIEKYKKHF